MMPGSAVCPLGGQGNKMKGPASCRAFVEGHPFIIDTCSADRRAAGQSQRMVRLRANT